MREGLLLHRILRLEFLFNRGDVAVHRLFSVLVQGMINEHGIRLLHGFRQIIGRQARQRCAELSDVVASTLQQVHSDVIRLQLLFSTTAISSSHIRLPSFLSIEF